MATTTKKPSLEGPEPFRRLRSNARGRLADPFFKWLITGSGVMVLIILAAMIGSTTVDSWPIFAKEGLSFFYDTDWDPGNSRSGEVEGTYGALEFIWGTLLTSLLAILFAVPLAIGIALYLTQLARPSIRRPLTYAVDLLAAVPSVVYGLWGALFLVPLLIPFMQFVAGTAGQVLPFLSGPVTVRNLFVAALILGIMILPIISAVIREVFATVPDDERFAAFGLGATRWEVMWRIVVSRCRPGIIGATMLGLGRALGETIAVLLVIGGNARLGFELFNTNQTMAAEIAAAFKEASPEHIKGLIALGVALFLITIIVNITARLVVSRMGHVTGDAAL